MEAPGRICIFCRHSIRQLAPKARAVATPRQQWVRSIASSRPTATLNSRRARTVASPESPWQGPRHTQTTRNRLLSRQRPFSASTYRPAAILNPRKDDDGEEMVVEITPQASNRLKQIMAKDSNPDLALRITVESGGCHGFQYLMSLTDMSKVSEEDDTVFEGADGARIVLDEPSLELLKGSKVDYTMELIGSQFKIVDNPLATSSCGCGTSFDIKA